MLASILSYQTSLTVKLSQYFNLLYVVALQVVFCLELPQVTFITEVFSHYFRLGAHIYTMQIVPRKADRDLIIGKR